MAEDFFRIKKHPFELKHKLSDGNILQVHHTICSTSDKLKRIRFLSVVFDVIQERFACSDHYGNIYVFDLTSYQYWPLSGHEPGSVVAFVPYRDNVLILATTKYPYNLLFIDTATGTIKSKLSGHKCTVKQVSFSNKNDILLTFTGFEAIIWELREYTIYFKLKLCAGSIIQIGFSPSIGNVVACLKDDTFRVWCRETLKPVRISLPCELKKIKCFAFATNGAVLAIGTRSTLSVHQADTWEIIKVVDMRTIQTNGVKAIIFLPQPLDGGCNKILAVLSVKCTLHLIDLEKMAVIASIIAESSISKISISCSGKYIACILRLGQINIYKSDKLISDSTRDLGQLEENPKKKRFVFETIDVDREVDECLNKERLRKILYHQFQYPDKHRLIIWKKLLEAPSNYDAYCDLINRPVHDSCKRLEKQVMISNFMYLKHAKRLVSCLRYWCHGLVHQNELHVLVFPFVKILHHEPMYCFEAVATILKNYCQLWFEWCPLTPVKVLCMVENILAEHDRRLSEHFCAVGITSEVYAFKLMSSVFSEVLTSSEWLMLWDHILTNHPSFVLMALVAYNIVHRTTLQCYYSIDQFEDFYSTQNPINMKAFIKKCYELLKCTSCANHPKYRLRNFTPLKRGLCYEQCEMRANDVFY